MSFLNFGEFQWWYLLAPILLALLNPLSRAVAVVLIGRCVSHELAKLAIPLVLRPVHLFWPFRRRKRFSVEK